jgi:uncharacterized protein
LLKDSIVTNKSGDFIWYELLTKNADAAGDFYGQVTGWTSSQSDQTGMDYRFFFSNPGCNDDDGVGGYMAITPEMAAGGARPAWVGYLAVDDVDASLVSIMAAGGRTLMPATDLQGVGRMAMVADPQGAPFYIMRPTPPQHNSDAQSKAFASTEPKVGHCAWNELATSDPESAIDFYRNQFGWDEAGEMNMGDMGLYRFIQASGGRFLIGAVYEKVEADPQSHWLFYFRVANLDKAMMTIAAKQGKIYMAPVPVPESEDFSLIAYDPDGAPFGLIGPRG